MSKYPDSDCEEEFEEGDDFSDMSWDRDPYETDEEYQERMEDLESYAEYD